MLVRFETKTTTIARGQRVWPTRQLCHSQSERRRGLTKRRQIVQNKRISIISQRAHTSIQKQTKTKQKQNRFHKNVDVTFHSILKQRLQRFNLLLLQAAALFKNGFVDRRHWFCCRRRAVWFLLNDKLLRGGATRDRWLLQKVLDRHLRLLRLLNGLLKSSLVVIILIIEIVTITQNLQINNNKGGSSMINEKQLKNNQGPLRAFVTFVNVGWFEYSSKKSRTPKKAKCSLCLKLSEIKLLLVRLFAALRVAKLDLLLLDVLAQHLLVVLNRAGERLDLLVVAQPDLLRDLRVRGVTVAHNAHTQHTRMLIEPVDVFKKKKKKNDTE